MPKMPRNDTLDYAKGMAIILMVIGHCYSSENVILSLIYSFHMPFFFIVSGMIYGRKATVAGSLSFSPEKAAKHLLIPYFVYEILFAVFLSLLDRGNGFIASFGGKLISIITFKGVTATWYLSCIFFVEVLFLISYQYKPRFTYVAAITLSIIGLLIAPYASGYSIPGIRCFIGLGFFCVGFLLGKCFIGNQSTCSFLMFFILCVAYGMLVWKNGMVSLVFLKISNPVLYVFSAACGSSIMLLTAYYFANSNVSAKIKEVISLFGRNTLIILCTHMFLLEIIRLVDYKIFNNLLPRMGLGEGIVFGIILCTIEYLFIPYYNSVKKKIQLAASKGA